MRFPALALLAVVACAPAARTDDPAPAGAAAGAGAAPSSADATPTTEREGRGRAMLLEPRPYSRIVVQRVDTVSMQLPAGSQVQTFDRTAYLSAIAERSGDGWSMTFVLDSVNAGAGSFLPPDSLEAATGTRWTAQLRPDGQLVDLAMDTVRGRPRSGVGDQTTRTIEVLFPVLPDEGARPGGAWSDSVETRIETGGFDVIERGLVRYTAQDEGAGMRVTGEGAFRQEGSGTQFGQELAMSGEGRRTITYRLDGRGQLLGAEGTDSAELEIIVPAMGQTVPLSQKSRFDVVISGR